MEYPYSFAPIARVQSCFNEKFGTPRQSGLVSSAQGLIVFEPEYANKDMLRGLEGFSHLWLIFVFHQSSEQGWRPTVRPPRLGGNERVGVWASRSPFRPNPIGLSVVRLEEIITEGKYAPALRVSGLDLVNGTPLLDIKPYVPYADSIPDAKRGFAPEAPTSLPVIIPESIIAQCDSSLIELIRETLSTDPRPAYHNDPERVYGILLENYNINWQIKDNTVYILSISPPSY